MSVEYVWFRDIKNYISFLSIQTDSVTGESAWKTPDAADTSAIIVKYTSNNITIADETTDLDTLGFSRNQQEAIIHWVMSRLKESSDPNFSIYHKRQFNIRLEQDKKNKKGRGNKPRVYKPYSLR